MILADASHRSTGDFGKPKPLKSLSDICHHQEKRSRRFMEAEKIVSNYDSSIIVRRWVACWIDFLLLFGIIVLSTKEIATNDLFFLLILSILICYYPVLEGLTGYTIGKYILKIKVVDKNLNSPGIIKAIIRTLLRIIEVNPFLAGGIPAGIIVWISKNKQRLGDIFAKTYVLKTKDIKNNILERGCKNW